MESTPIGGQRMQARADTAGEDDADSLFLHSAHTGSKGQTANGSAAAGCNTFCKKAHAHVHRVRLEQTILSRRCGDQTQNVMRRIGILTAGGDTAALNAAIRGAVARANLRP